MDWSAGFRLGHHEVHPLQGRVRGPDGALRVEPKAMEVLLELARHAPSVCARDQIEKAVWPRGWVTQDALTRCIGQLRCALAEDPRSPAVLETIPKRGYRLCLVPQPLTAAALDAPPKLEALLVLPFRALSTGPDTVVAEGVTELLILRLSELRGLRILSRTTSMQFRDAAISIAEVAGRSGADWLVEGTVLQSGDRVQVVAQLIDARTDAHLWAADYTCELQDLLALQNEIAARVADAIRARLGREGAPAPAPPPPLVPAAMRAYLRGRHFMSRRTVPALREAIGAMSSVSAAAPAFAAAWASRAECEMLLMHYGAEPVQAMLGPCQAHLDRALTLDPDLGIGLSTRGALRFFFELDFAGAQDDLTRALTALPSYSLAMVQMASVSAVCHRFDDARGWIGQALLVDPFDVGVNINVGDHMMLQRRPDQAVLALRRTLELAVDQRPSQLRLAWALALDGQHAAAREQLARTQPSGPGEAAWLETAALVEAACGNSDAARAHDDALLQLGTGQRIAPWTRARAAAAASRHATALDALEAAAQERTSSWPFLRLTPAFDALHGTPRFEALATALPRAPAG
ncbi:MAG: hypothetical protein ABS84_13290 [Rubrivivax sp. SCN 71-131]|jgi:TolB-like protein/Tfp pilus assembly protein PilF|nr:MAG: hypothetical protein ABS84_13290 [Rubrivivax sp. SCN 71-131]